VLILALDTTTRAGSVALLRAGTVVHEHSGEASRTHSERLPGDLMAACEAAGVAIREIDLFAVAAGPGSFTGLRTGIAAIQGVATAVGRLVVPVSALEAIALTAPPGTRRVAAWMDAQRGEVFAQVFDMDEQGSSARPLVDALAATPAEALTAHAALLDGATFHGDGAARYAEQIRTSAHGAGAPHATAAPPLAGAIGRIAAHHPERAVRPHAVIPIYVRRPDVELARERRALRA